MALPVRELDSEVIITPTGRSTVTLEGGFDAIYAQLLNIKQDARLVPYAHKPVELAGGRVRVTVDLVAGPAALAVIEGETAAPERTKRVWPRPRLPQWDRATWHLIGWWTAATISLAVMGALVWGAVIAAQVVAAFISAWAAPLIIGGVLVLGGIGMAFERHEKNKAAERAAQAEIITAALAGTAPAHTTNSPTSTPPTASAQPHHWLTGKPTGTTSPSTIHTPASAGTTSPSTIHTPTSTSAAQSHHWLTGRSTGSAMSNTAKPAFTQQQRQSTGRPTGTASPSTIHTPVSSSTTTGQPSELQEDAEPERHWWGGIKMDTHEQQWAAIRGVPDPVTEPPRYKWWGGLTDEAKVADQQERFGRLDPAAQQWVSDLRDPGAKQAKGVYDDECGRYCAVGLETHKHRRMSHQQMQRRFGRSFVYDVEKYNDSTKATFADVADYIERELS